MTSMPHISPKAVVIGSIIDLGGGILASALYSIVLSSVLLAQGVPEADMENRILTDPSYYIATLILGFGSLGTGTFVAARVARGAELTHAAIVAVVGGVIAIVFVLISDTTKWPSWYISVSFGLTLPIGLLGGYVAKRIAASSPSRAA
jgi:hypothetical protein